MATNNMHTTFSKDCGFGVILADRHTDILITVLLLCSRLRSSKRFYSSFCYVVFIWEGCVEGTTIKKLMCTVFLFSH